MDGRRRAEVANEQFHHVYDQMRRQKSLAMPVMVVCADELVLIRGGERTSCSFASVEFHIIKAVAHAVITAFNVTYPFEGRAPLNEARVGLGHASSLRTSVAECFPDPADRAVLANLMALLQLSETCVCRCLAEPTRSKEIAEGFAHEAGPKLLRATEDASRVELRALHAAATSSLGELDEAERDTLEVVVLGDHQARVRSLGMQYFAKLLGGPGRVTYGEGMTTVEDALALVGTRRLDRVLAGAFFGDPDRLQRDILGDAVEKELEGFDLRWKRD